LQLFASYLGSDQVGHPGDIPAWVRQVGDEPFSQRIRADRHDDGDRPGGILRRPGRCGRCRNDDIDFEADQFGDERAETVEHAIRVSFLDDNVLAIDPAALAQSLPKRGKQVPP
jgi:hypothetical protein